MQVALSGDRSEAQQETGALTCHDERSETGIVREVDGGAILEQDTYCFMVLKPCGFQQAGGSLVVLHVHIVPLILDHVIHSHRMVGLKLHHERGGDVIFSKLGPLPVSFFRLGSPGLVGCHVFALRVISDSN